MSTEKILNKKVVLTTAQFEQRKSAGTLQEGVEYELSDAKDAVEGVTIDGTSIVDATTHVANIPVGNGVVGVLKADGYYQLQLDSGNAVNAKSIPYANYDTGSVNLFVGKGTLETVLDNETVRFDKATSLTDAQKTQARTNIGAYTAIEYTGSESSYEDVVFYYTVD